MKLTIVGLGQCGGRIADEFNRLNTKARSNRRMMIMADVLAVNSDIADLSSLTSVKSDYRHRILIGNREADGHGVGKINETGAKIAEEDGDKVIDALRSVGQTYEADAFLLIAGAAGGTGSGSLPIMTRIIKDRFRNKPVYALVALPFEHEEQADARTFWNTATCLRSVHSVADAVFLCDNQRYIEKDSSLMNNMTAINQLIAQPFFDLLCAGEVVEAKNVGARLLDAADISMTLGGWTTLGYGVSQPSTIRHSLVDFRTKSSEIHKGIQAMEQALSNLSVECDPKYADSALYLLSGPTRETNIGLVKELLQHLNEAAPEAIIRYGDYPRAESTLTITVILSQLSFVERVKECYDSVSVSAKKNKIVQKRNRAKVKELADASALVPSLFSGNGDK